MLLLLLLSKLLLRSLLLCALSLKALVTKKYCLRLLSNCPPVTKSTDRRVSLVWFNRTLLTVLIVALLRSAVRIAVLYGRRDPPSCRDPDYAVHDYAIH